MATKMKGLFKGIKYISQIFVYKEHEMEIGYPTDVRHVAHIGWDSSTVNSPSWMNEFKIASSDFSSTSLSNFGQSLEASWASQECPLPNIPKAPKKTKRKKPNLSSSSSSSSSSRSSSRSSKSRASYATAIEEAEMKNKFVMV